MSSEFIEALTSLIIMLQPVFIPFWEENVKRVITDVSEEHIASIIRMKIISELGTLAVTSN
jgi:hypothetical protein